MSFDNCKDDYLNIPNQRFYYRSTELVAKELLGKKLVRIIRESNNKIYRLSGLIVETEAYGFDEDAASHAYRGLLLEIGQCLEKLVMLIFISLMEITIV